MAGISSVIQLYDNATAPLMNIISSLNLTISAFEDMQEVSEREVDTASIDGAWEAAERAASAIVHMREEAERAAAAGQRVQTPVWETSAHNQIFNTSGVERMNQEIASMQELLNGVLDAQQRIDQQALQTEILPPNAIWDINLTGNRLSELAESIRELQTIDVGRMDISSIDRANAEYEQIRASLTEAVNLQERLNQAADTGDVAGMNAEYERLNNTMDQLELRARHFRETMQMPPPVWQSDMTVQVFAGSDTERYRQEITSVNQIMQQLQATQGTITARAGSMRILPSAAMNDINGMTSRIDQIRQRIEAISKNPLNVGSAAANRGLEQLRAQLTQAIQRQNEMNTAMQRMDVAEANRQYRALSDLIATTERNIRDNVDEQNRFNDSIREGAREADGLSGKIVGLVASYASLQGLKNLGGLSDTMAMSSARLSLIVDDNSTVEELENKIYASAQRSRAVYGDVAASVSKLGLMAGDAFSSNDEIIAFTELMNKNFKIGGASVTEQASAMYQLTQAMASGRLQGDEYRSIIENAPLLAKSIEDYMINVQHAEGSMKDWASEGLLTANVIKAALFGSADEIEERYSNLPMTWGDVWNNAMNELLQISQPILDFISLLAQNWESLKPAVIGAAIAVGFFAVATWIANGAAKTFFKTLLKNPLFWIAMLIGIVVALIYKWVQSVGGLKIAWLIAMDKIKTAWDWVGIGITTGIYWVINKFEQFKLGIFAVSTGIQNFIGDMKVGVLNTLQDMINGAIDIINDFISMINRIPGLSIDLIDHVSFGTSAAIENEANKVARNEELANYANEINQNIANRGADLEQMKTDARAATARRQAEILQAKEELAKKQAAEKIEIPQDPYVPGLASDVGAMKDSMEISSEDLKYMRDIAARDNINRFTTAEVKVDLGGVIQNVSQGQDLDGIISYMVEGVEEGLSISAEKYNYG